MSESNISLVSVQCMSIHSQRSLNSDMMDCYIFGTNTLLPPLLLIINGTETEVQIDKPPLD